MTSVTLPFRSADTRPTRQSPVPWWMAVGGVVMVASCVPAFWPWKSERTLDNVVGASFLLRSALHAVTYAWASQRTDLPPRFRQVLQAFAAIGAFGMVVSLLELLGTLGTPILPSWAGPASTILVFAARVMTVLRYPLVRRHGLDAALASDILISLAGYGTLMVVLVTLPSLATGEPDARWAIISAAVVQLLLLVSINVLVLRGEMIPSRRAFWCMVAGMTIYLPTHLISQLEYAAVIGYGWSATVFYLGVLPDLAAAWCIRNDPIPRTPVPRRPTWLADINPVPLTAPLALGTFLLLAVIMGPPQRVTIFGTALVLTTALLIVRVILSGREHARLLLAQSELRQQQEREKTEAIGRLAGGIAHEFNNAMTVVMGCAELGQTEAEDPAAVREDFAMIHDAAGRVVNLTTRLLAFSGRQAVMRRPVDLQAAVLQKLPDVRAALPANITLVADQVEPVGELPVDPHQFSFMCRQLLDNAIEAMPSGGVLAISLRLERTRQAIATSARMLPPGWYATYTVRDTGVGIADDVQRMVFEPFFSTRKMHEASGLGLAAVQGIVAAHDGGIVVESAPGQGTAVRIHLPAPPPA